MNPFIPILLLLVGAAAMLVGLFIPKSRAGALALVPMGSSVLALMAGLVQGFSLPGQMTISDWPSELFRMSLSLSTDRGSWLFELSLLVICAGTCLTGLTRPGGPRLGSRTAGLLITA